MDTLLVGELKDLVIRMRGYESKALKESLDFASSTRVSGYFQGTANGIAFVLDNLITLIEENQ